MYGIAMLYSHRQGIYGRTVQDERALALDEAYRGWIGPLFSSRSFPGIYRQDGSHTW